MELDTSKTKIKREVRGFGDERIVPGSVIYTDGAEWEGHPTRKLSFFFIDNHLAGGSVILAILSPKKDEYAVGHAKLVKQYGNPTREDIVGDIIRTEWEGNDALLSIVREKAYRTCVVSLDAKLKKLRALGGVTNKTLNLIDARAIVNLHLF